VGKNSGASGLRETMVEVEEECLVIEKRKKKKKVQCKNGCCVMII